MSLPRSLSRLRRRKYHCRCRKAACWFVYYVRTFGKVSGLTDQIAKCGCASVVIKVLTQPIVSASCYCADCRSAAQIMEAMPNAPRLREADDGTRVQLFRKDRVDVFQGEHLLREFRLKPDSPTCRVVASCCNSPMFLDFTSGFWVSIYEQRIVQPSSIPARIYKAHSPRFLSKLMLTWATMGFRALKLRKYPAL